MFQTTFDIEQKQVIKDKITLIREQLSPYEGTPKTTAQILSQRKAIHRIRQELSSAYLSQNNMVAAIATGLRIPHGNEAGVTFLERAPQLHKPTFRLRSTLARMGMNAIREYAQAVDARTPDATNADRVRLIVMPLQAIGVQINYAVKPDDEFDAVFLDRTGAEIFGLDLLKDDAGTILSGWRSPYRNMPMPAFDRK